MVFNESKIRIVENRKKVKVLKYLALIPARGGSKGIPRKNLAPLGNHPLTAWAVVAARKSEVFREIAVSSDDIDILKTGRDYGATTLIERPVEISGDSTRQIDVIKHAFQDLDAVGKDFEHVVLLQPTSPFRSPNLILEAIKLHKRDISASVISVTEVTHMNDSTIYRGELHNLLNIEGTNRVSGSLRQTFVKKFWRNGSIYILNRKDIFDGTLYSERVLGIHVSGELSINIDTLEDLEIARNFLFTPKGQEIYDDLF